MSQKEAKRWRKEHRRNAKMMASSAAGDIMKINLKRKRIYRSLFYLALIGNILQAVWRYI